MPPLTHHFLVEGPGGVNVIKQAGGYYSNLPIYAPVYDSGGQFFNVKSYGAKGDGISDDSAAFNSANTAATSAKGTIYVPHGTYILNPTTLGAFTASMRGESMNGTILKVVSGFNATQNLIRIVSVSDIIVGNFTVDGNKANIAGGTQYGLYISTTTNSGAYNVQAQNWTGVGIHYYNNTRSFGYNFYSTGNTFHGLEFEQNTKCSFVNIHGYSNTLHGVLVSPGEVNGTGSKGNTFTNLQCDGNSQYGLAFNAANGDVSAWLSEGDVFNGVSLTNNTQYGLNIYKQDKQTFNGLYVANNGFFGIYLFESQYNTFSDLFLHNNSQAGNGSYDEVLIEGYSSNNAHPSTNNVFHGGDVIIDGTTKARYAFNEGTANDGSNTYLAINVPNAGTAGRYNVLAVTSSVLSGATGFGVASNATLPSNQMGLDAPFGTAALRLYNPNAGGNFQFVTPNGSSQFWAGGNDVVDISGTGIAVNNGYGFKLATAPTANYVLTSDASGNGTWQRPSIMGFTQTASATVANTLTETSLMAAGVGSLTIPANFLIAGKTIFLRVTGNHSATANPNITIRVKIGSVVVLTTGAVASGNSTNAYFEITGYITCRTTGVSGTVWAEGVYIETGGGTGSFSMTNTAATTIDTTSSQLIDVTAQWGTASTSDTISSNVAFMYYIN